MDSDQLFTYCVVSLKIMMAGFLKKPEISDEE